MKVICINKTKFLLTAKIWFGNRQTAHQLQCIEEQEKPTLFTFFHHRHFFSSSSRKCILSKNATILRGNEYEMKVMCERVRDSSWRETRVELWNKYECTAVGLTTKPRSSPWKWSTCLWNRAVLVCQTPRHKYRKREYYAYRHHYMCIAKVLGNLNCHGRCNAQANHSEFNEPEHRPKSLRHNL